MPIDPRWFTWANKHGAKVGARARHADGTEGTITRVWFGLEETLTVQTDAGEVVYWHPAEGLDDVTIL